MKNTFKFALVGALLAVAAPVASATDCYTVSKTAAKEIAAKPKNVLAIVSKQVAVNEACTCEIVKSAIVITEADKKLVAQIVEQAMSAAPKKISLITTCALAVAPDAHVEVLEVASKYTKSKGESYSAKSKENYSAKAADDDDESQIVTSDGVVVVNPLSHVSLDQSGNFSANVTFIPEAGTQGAVADPYSSQAVSQ